MSSTQRRSPRKGGVLRARHRLFWQIYVSFVGVVLAFAALAALGWWLFDDGDDHGERHEIIAEILSGGLPAADRPAAELRATLERVGEKLDARLSVYAPDRSHIASSGEPVPLPMRGDHRERPPRRQGWVRGPRGRVFVLRLTDGRWVAGAPAFDRGPRLLKALALLAVAIGLGAWPLARRIVRRLERLNEGVQAFGGGDLGARVHVRGKDEVAALGIAFNDAAGRIERLVEAQRSTLAGASHELRSPLARMRLSIELLEQDNRPELREQLRRDIAELDVLIGELLIASRIETGTDAAEIETVDLLALAAEEGARVDANVSGAPVSITGDARLLARLLRNLFENARRYGEGTEITCQVGSADAGGRDAGDALIEVCDGGPGVAAEEQERVFEPFYRPKGISEDGRGVGLGLALVRQIARRHGGDVRCLPKDPSPGARASCFEVRLSGWRSAG